MGVDGEAPTTQVRLRHLEQLVEIISRSQRGYRELIDSFEDLVFLISLNGEIQAANRPVAALIGRNFPEFIGRPFCEFLAEPDIQTARAALPVFLKKRAWSGTIAVRPNSTAGVRYLDCVFNAIVKNGEVVGISALARDVTQRKGLEDQLRQAQKMEAIGRLAGGIAHDFNNLLTVIKGYAELLTLEATGTPRLQRATDEITRAANRAVALTRQLLAFSRRQVLHPKVLDVGALVTGVASMLRRLIGEDVELVTELGDSPHPVKADPGQLEQVLMNLAVNARDAMPDGGTIRIAADDVVVPPGTSISGTPLEPGEYLLLTVSDTGIGMDTATQTRVFEPFFTTKDPTKGTGLGLSTAYGIIKQSGGYIFVESSPGQGATFLIYLPRVNEPIVDLVIPAIPATEIGTETILVVEDEENVRTLLAEMLRRKQYQVLEAASGPEALSVCEKHAGRINLLMTDVVIPGMRGPEIAQQLRARYPGLKVLFMSGYMEEAAALSAEQFLQKPFTMSSLAAKVREVLAM